MSPKFLPFACGLLVGGAVTAGFFATRAHAPVRFASQESTVGTATEASGTGVETDSSLAIAKEQLARLEADNLQLATRVQDLLKKDDAATTAAAKKSDPGNPFAALFGQDDGHTNGMAKAMKGMMESALKQQLEGKLAQIHAKVGTTPDQEQAIREILEKQANVSREISQKMMSGKMTKEEMAEAVRQQGDPEAQIKALLSPEQQTAYSELKVEERRTNARLVANSGLLQMQQVVGGIDQAQQDKIFEVLYSQTERTLTGPAPAADGTTADGAAKPVDMRSLSEQKLAALKGVLTEEQFGRYKEMQEQQIKMFEAFMPKDSKAGDTVVPNIQVITAPAKP